MSFYLRKSLRAGPFRYNFSKSGVGVSAGFTGFRIGTGPRGNYVHMGRHGLYYRATLPGSNKPSQPSRKSSRHPLNIQVSSVEMQDIESVDVLQLQDSSSADLLAEMNNKHKKFQIWPIAVVFSAIVIIVLLALKVQYWVHLLVVPVAIVAGFLAYRRDQLTKSVVLFYDMDGVAESAFQSLHDAFNELVDCAKAWHVSSSGSVNNLSEQKRQAGANSLVRRSAIRFNIQTPPFVNTNLSIPAIPVGKQTLYLFPDRILVYESGKVGAVSYFDVHLQIDNTRFIESESVPPDAQVVGQTWQFVNKNGRPDKRFKNNRQLPIVLYGELYFQSSTGLNELIQVSKANVGSTLSDSFKKLISIQQSINVPAK